MLLTSNSGWLLHPRACIKKKRHLWFFFPLLFPCLFWFKNQHPESWSWNCLSLLRNRSICGIHDAATCVTRQRWLWHPYVCRGNAPGPEHCFLLNLQDAEIKIKWSSGFKWHVSFIYFIKPSIFKTVFGHEQSACDSWNFNWTALIGCMCYTYSSYTSY